MLKYFSDNFILNCFSMRYDFAKKIDDLLLSERRTKKSLYDHLKMTGTGFDAMMRNNSFSAVRLAAIADFFSIQVAELYGEIAPLQDKSNGADNEGRYLQEHLLRLEQKFEELHEQLTVKDRQIDGLQRMLESVLGKSRSVTFTQLPSEDDEFGTGYDKYVQSAVKQITNIFGSNAVPLLHT